MAVIVVHNWSEFITAVGTSGAEVEFPKSLVRTTDTSVDPNKLYTDADGVVQTNVQPSDLANLYENTFILDANDYAPEGLTSNIVFACADFNGYGGRITNLNFGASYYFSGSNSPKIENTAFMNLISNADRLFYNFKLEKIIVSASLNDDYTTIFMFCDLDQCSAYLTTLNKTTHTGLWYFTSTVNNTQNCRITIDYDSVTFWLYHSTNFYLKGSVTQLALDRHNAYGVVDCNVATSVYGGENWGNDGIILVNSDKVGGSISAQYAVGVTTAQLKDASYLSSIGFPIQT